MPWGSLVQHAAHVQAAKPALVVAAESSAESVEGDIIETMEAYNLALGRYTHLVRSMLPSFDGYECKEPEPGKFTLAFKYAPVLAACDRLLQQGGKQCKAL